MMQLFRSSRWLLLASGILLVALGIATLFTPVGSLVSLALFISIAMLVSGISEIVAYFCDARGSRSGWVLAGGIMSLLLGLWLLFGQGFAALAAVIPYMFAVWVTAAGISRTVGSFSMKDVGYSGWGWVLALGILETLCGLSLMCSPILSALISGALITVMFISHGAGNIALFNALGRARKALDEMMDAPEQKAE